PKPRPRNRRKLLEEAGPRDRQAAGADQQGGPGCAQGGGDRSQGRGVKRRGGGCAQGARRLGRRWCEGRGVKAAPGGDAREVPRREAPGEEGCPGKAGGAEAGSEGGP